MDFNMLPPPSTSAGVFVEWLYEIWAKFRDCACLASPKGNAGYKIGRCVLLYLSQRSRLTSTLLQSENDPERSTFLMYLRYPSSNHKTNKNTHERDLVCCPPRHWDILKRICSWGLICWFTPEQYLDGSRATIPGPSKSSGWPLQVTRPPAPRCWKCQASWPKWCSLISKTCWRLSHHHWCLKTTWPHSSAKSLL